MTEMVVHKRIEDAIRSATSASGVRASVLEIAAALCAGRVIAEGISQVPLKVLRPDGTGGSEQAEDHPVYNLLRWAPNDWMTSFELREMLTLHAVFSGNGYAFINRVDGKVREIIPLVPDRVVVRQDRTFGVFYELYDYDSGLIGAYDKELILHLRGPSLNSYAGVDIVQAANIVLGLSGALQAGQKRSHDRNRKPDGILSYEGGKLDQGTLIRMRNSWNERFGPNGEGGVAVIEDAWKYLPISQSAADSQTIESREFQINEVARIFRVFPQMLMQAQNTATYASAEQFFQAHVTHTLMPWGVRWEQVIKRDLLGITTPEYAKHNWNGLLRGVAKDRGEFYSKMIQMGAFTRNEVRGWEDLNPKDGLDEPLTPMNMAVGTDNSQDKPA